MRSAVFWEITQCILVCQYTLRDFPEERRSQILLHLASDNHSDDKVLSQFGSDSYSDRYHSLIIVVILTVIFYYSF